jgi:uncharacterized protein
MVDIEEMAPAQAISLLRKVEFGHLGCARNGRPYVLPVHYSYAEPYIYLFTTEGLKTEFIAANPEICLQVEEVEDSAHWRSVVVTGRAERLTRQADKDYAMSLITRDHPSLDPAINRTWTDAWGRASVAAIYRIRPEIVSGRDTGKGA